MLLAPVGVSAQATFGAATVKPARTVSDIVPGVFRANGQWVGQAATLSMLVRSAYDLPAERIIGLPSWAMSERYDVVTTSEPERSSEQLHLMARELLREKFGLRVHMEQRILEIYALVRVHDSGVLGPGLRPAVMACEHGTTDAPPESKQGCAEIVTRGRDEGSIRYHVKDRLLSDFMIMISARQAVGGPIVDRTGLTGGFDIDFEFAARSVPVTDAASFGTPLAVALLDQLGLRLERQSLPLDVLIVDAASRPSPDN